MVKSVKLLLSRGKRPYRTLSPFLSSSFCSLCEISFAASFMGADRLCMSTGVHPSLCKGRAWQIFIVTCRRVSHSCEQFVQPLSGGARSVSTLVDPACQQKSAFFSKKVSPASKTRFNSRDHGPEPRQRAPGRAIREKSLRLFLNASASCRKALGSPRSLPEESFQLLLQSCSSRPHSVPLFQKAWRRPIPGRRGPCLLLFVLLRVQFQPKRSGSCLIVSAVQTQGAFGTDHYGCRRLGASLFAEAATVAAVGLHHGHGHRHAVLCNDVHGSIGAVLLADHAAPPFGKGQAERPVHNGCAHLGPALFLQGQLFQGACGTDRPAQRAVRQAGAKARASTGEWKPALPA